MDALVGPGYRGWYLCYLIAVLWLTSAYNVIVQPIFTFLVMQHQKDLITQLITPFLSCNVTSKRLLNWFPRPFPGIIHNNYYSFAYHLVHIDAMVSINLFHLKSLFKDVWQKCPGCWLKIASQHFEQKLIDAVTLPVTCHKIGHVGKF